MKPEDIYILIGCEESQAVTIAFRVLGFQAFSCDIQECSGGHPEWHIQGDVFEAIKSQKFDLAIFHPPCTYLSVSGNRWYKAENLKYDPTKPQKRESAVKFFMELVNSDIQYIAVENPKCIMSSRFRKPDQIIHPWQYGHEAKKETCLWLKNLPNLSPNEIVGKGELTAPSARGYRMPAWSHGTKIGWNTPEIKKLRSKTFPGIAKAMADQWGDYLLNNLKE